MSISSLFSVKERNSSLRLENEELRERNRILEAERSSVCLREIELDRICTRNLPENAVDNDDGIAALADSITAVGLIEPLVVRVLTSGSNSFGSIYSLVCGSRRLRALRMTGASSAPCVIIPDNSEMSSAISLSSNIHCRLPHYFEVADYINDIMLAFSLTEEEVARRLALPVDTVFEKLKLLEFSGGERAIIVGAGLGETLAHMLLSIGDVGVRIGVLQKIVSRKMSEYDAAECIRFACGGNQRKTAIRDLKFFFNSIDRSVELLRRSGIDVELSSDDKGDRSHISIVLHKPHAARGAFVSRETSTVGSPDVSRETKQPI